MCGICGYIEHAHSGSDLKALVKNMANTIVHRGPDEEGYHVENAVALGMRRLKIIDLVTGSQPIYNERKDIVVVFNGEIYNYRELRAELKGEGYRFHTDSDTEVLVHLYDKYGHEMLSRLNGMFAFCVYDSKKNEIFIARDRVGIKPLYYVATDSFFAFASEMKPLLVLPQVSKGLNLEAIDEYLTLEYSVAPNTVVEAIKKLRPAHAVTLSVGEATVSIDRYWDIKQTGFMVNEDECVDRLRATLTASVKRRLVSDVPLGIFLSGGIDSSILTGLMAQHMGEPVKTFSIGFENQSYNELHFARSVAERFGTEHHESIIDADFVSLMDSVTDYLDEPMADVSIFPTYLVSREARKNVTVVLSGDGGDELFGGYDTYRAHMIASGAYSVLPRWIRNTAAPVMVSLLRPTQKKKGIVNKIKRFVDGAALSSEYMQYRWMMYASEQQKKALYCGKMAQFSHSFEDIFRNFHADQSSDTLNRMMLMDMALYLPEDILTKVDRMSMAVSLEARVPFLDHEVVECAFAIPGKLKLNNTGSKKILKKAFADILPKEILQRGKEGFSIPLKNWLRFELKDRMHDVLSHDNLNSLGLFKYEGISQLMKQHVAGSHNNAHLLWSLMLFVMWHDKYIKR